MTPAHYLIDTSALVRLLRDPRLRASWEPEIVAGLVAICPITELEFLFSARSATDRAELRERLRIMFTPMIMPDRVYERAHNVQAELTARGTHRSAGAVDLLLAATAELTALTLLHYDRDFDQITRITGQPARWVAEPGTVK